MPRPFIFADRALRHRALAHAPCAQDVSGSAKQLEQGLAAYRRARPALGELPCVEDGRGMASTRCRASSH